MTSEHWAYKRAGELKKSTKNKAIVCASGISPSGHIHIGNLREVTTTDFVYRALQEEGVEARFIFSWDDFDRFRKIPKGFPESLESSIGKPYSMIEDPFGEYNSYAERFESEFEEALAQLGIFPEFIKQTDMYTSGQYDGAIRELLHKRSQVAEILARNMTQGMTDEQKKSYFPAAIYSRFTLKDRTRILSYDGDSKITYLCHETGKKDTIDFTQDRLVKLPWKIDWPMRWVFEDVDFEPGGPDHASPGSSYDVASQIIKEVFSKEAPSFQEYQFVRVKGENAKMSSSSGNTITPQELLKIYPAELIRWMYAKSQPNSILDIALDQDVIKNHAEFDKLMKTVPTTTLERKIAFLSQVNPNRENTALSVNFRTLVGLGEATDFNKQATFQLLDDLKEPYDKENTSKRLDNIHHWLTNHFTIGRKPLLEKFNLEHYSSLSAEEKSQIHQLRTLLTNSNVTSLTDIEAELYAIPKKEEMDDTEKKKAQRRFFKNVYRLWFGKDRGPRLPTYVWGSTSKKRLNDLLNQNET